MSKVLKINFASVFTKEVMDSEISVGILEC